jgi:lipoyl(octanoyl) transferase
MAAPIPAAPIPSLRLERVGLGTERVDYERAWQLQREVHADVVAGRAPDTVLLLEHPPTYTAGRRTGHYERPTDGTPVVDVDRGGRITWHGPGQLVGYPIVRLAGFIDVVAYVRRVEEALIGVCADLGLTAVRVEGRTGVWLPADPPRDDSTGSGPGSGPGRRERKVAAIGVRVARGVTMHGFALNCDPDLRWFDRIVPCGIDDADVTSLSAELGRDVTIAEALPLVERHLLDVDLAGTGTAARKVSAAAG